MLLLGLLGPGAQSASPLAVPACRARADTLGLACHSWLLPGRMQEEYTRWRWRAWG